MEWLWRRDRCDRPLLGPSGRQDSSLVARPEPALGVARVFTLSFHLMSRTVELGVSLVAIALDVIVPSTSNLGQRSLGLVRSEVRSVTDRVTTREDVLVEMTLFLVY